MAKLNLTAIIVTVIVIVGVLTGVFLLIGQTSVGEKNTVSATGTAQMTVPPDEAVVYLLVEARDASADNAKNKNARISDDVLTALIKVGVERKDIETENFNIYPEYDWSNEKQTLKGYVASNTMKVTVKDFNNVGKIVDAAVDSGALVNYINFELSLAKQNDYKVSVLANASQDARRKAEAITSGLGKKLGDLVSVQSSDYGYMPYPLYARAESAGAAEVKSVATNIQPKNLEITATVTASFEIK